MGGFSAHLWWAVVTKVSPLKTYVIDFENKIEPVSRSKYCLKVSLFDIFHFTHKEEKVWPDGTQPILFAESSCVSMPKF